MSAPTPSLSPAESSSGMIPVTNARRWTIVGLLFVASLINYFDRATVSFALPTIAKDLGLGPNEKGTLLSAFFWSYALMQIPMGILADKVNLRWLYAIAFVLWSLAQGLMGTATTLGMLVVFRIILGVGEAIYLPGGTRVVSLFFPLSDRGLPCGLFDFGTRTGLVLEGVMVPFLVANYGWRITFAVVGFSALLWLIPWLLFTPRQMRCEPPVPSPEQPRMTGKDFLALLGNRDLFGICLGFFCFDYYWYLLVTWLPDYMVNVRHLTLQWAGIYTALPFLVFGASQPIGGWIADHLVRKGWNETKVRKRIVSVAFLTGLFLIPAAQATHANAALAFIMLGCLVGFSTANQIVILQNCAPPAQIGLWVGIYNFVGNIAGILAPKVTGFVIDQTGSYTPAFVLAAVMIAAGQLSYLFIVGPLRRK
jgi:ACS family D-galactonate transporter-like MFS transporter